MSFSLWGKSLVLCDPVIFMIQFRHIAIRQSLSQNWCQFTRWSKSDILYIYASIKKKTHIYRIQVYIFIYTYFPQPLGVKRTCHVMWHFRIGKNVNDLVWFAWQHFSQTPVWMLIWMWIEQKTFPETPLCYPFGGNMDTAYLNSLFVLFGSAGESVMCFFRDHLSKAGRQTPRCQSGWLWKQAIENIMAHWYTPNDPIFLLKNSLGWSPLSRNSGEWRMYPLLSASFRTTVNPTSPTITVLTRGPPSFSSSLSWVSIC